MMYALIVLLIVFSAFFSGTEIAYTSANRSRILKKAEEGSGVAKLALWIYDRFDSSLTALLIGNNFVNIAASAVSTTIAIGIAAKLAVDGAENDGLAATVATAVITVLILIFGEIVPKVVFKKNADKMACATAYPLMFFIILFSPITLIVSGILKVCTLIWGKAEETVTEDEMETLIETVEEQGGIDEDKSELLQSALDFANTTLAEIITHRTEVLALDVEEEREENLRVIYGSKFSRLPVYKDSIDTIIGVLNVSQYFKCLVNDPNAKIEDVMLEPKFLPSTLKLPDALDEMREEQVQLVVVPDEYGGTLGIVTMEDILEQIVGEIWDERDEIEYDIEQNEDGSYKVAGDMNVYDFFDEVDVDDRDFTSDCNTVGGWCVEMLGQSPEVGLSFSYKNLTIELVDVEETHVSEVHVTVNPVEEDEEE